MKRVLLLRHAKSSWDNAYLSDFERPLNKRGRADAPRMGKLVRAEALTPDLILSSPAVRAAKTAEEVALASGYEGEITFVHDLYHADPETMVALLRALDPAIDSVMLVGHNPGMVELAGGWSDQVDRMPTAALGAFDLPVATWAQVAEDGPATLAGFWLPRELSW